MSDFCAPSPLAFVQCILALGSRGRTTPCVPVSCSTSTPRAVVVGPRCRELRKGSIVIGAELSAPLRWWCVNKLQVQRHAGGKHT